MNVISPLAIPYQTPRVSYALGATPPATYTIPWQFWTLNNDLIAVFVDSAGVQHSLVNGTDFTVAGNTPIDPQASYYDGGIMTLLTTWTNGTLTLWRNPLLTRSTSISTTGPLDVKTVNAQLDQIFTLLQDLSLQNAACYGVDYTQLANSFPKLVLPMAQSGYLLGWGTGQTIINYAAASAAPPPTTPGLLTILDVTATGGTLGLPTGGRIYLHNSVAPLTLVPPAGVEGLEVNLFDADGTAGSFAISLQGTLPGDPNPTPTLIDYAYGSAVLQYHAGIWNRTR